MIIVKIIGGLGNQMFQYAYAKALEQKGYEVKLDISAFETYKLHGGYQLDKYNVDLAIANKYEIDKYVKKGMFSKVLSKLGLGNSDIVKEKSLLFEENFFRFNDNKYIDGYFQCEMYFLYIKNTLLKEFIIKNNLARYTEKLKSDIFKAGKSCSLHIRRGDYISDEKSNIIHGTCSLDYYKNAMNVLNDKFIDIKYFVFSDDINWVKKNLQVDNAVYIDSDEKRIPHEDIYLMSLCSHNIIANSSFSWWGAWLNQNENKIVIAPQKWFNDENMYMQSSDIVPKSWIRL